LNKKTIEEVETFWNENPLFSGESNHKVGSFNFFEDHKNVYINDVFSGRLPSEIFMPESIKNKKVLDLGCGVGFWTIEIQQTRKGSEFHSGDLTGNAVKITNKRLKLYNLKSKTSIQNAERTLYKDNYFDHINCQGVIHHTPNTEQCVKEIARILKPGGTAYISVYYKNILLRNWAKISFIGKFLFKLGGGLKGRGRENIFKTKDVNDIVRLYDGDKNPIGKAYSKKEFIKMVTPFFKIKRTDLFFFPARALPFKISNTLHKFLSKNMGFMIHFQLVKK
jgi:ubiquinone/menaquinone biosynthesis C-methylase UbiE